jgi:hypothetical protein
MPTPIYDPSLVGEIQSLREEIELLKAAPRWRTVTFPAVPLGNPENQGFNTIDTTTYEDFFRADVLLTAPILNYDIQVSNAWETTAVTSIEWRIQAGAYFTDGSPFSFVTVDSGQWLAAAPAITQFSDFVDLTDPSLLGPAALFRLVRIDFEAKRTGGSGPGAGLRLVRPPILRIPS